MEGAIRRRATNVNPARMLGLYPIKYNVLDFEREKKLKKKYMLYKDQYKNTLEKNVSLKARILLRKIFQ